MQNTEDTLQTRWPTGAWGSHPPQHSHGHPTHTSAGQHALFPGLLLSARGRHPQHPETRARLAGALDSH